MHHRDNLTGIFCCSPVIWCQCKKLVRAGGKVLAWPVLVAPFVDNDQPARFPWVFSFGVLQCVVLPRHDAADPMPGKLPYGNSALAPNLTWQLLSLLPHTSRPELPTGLLFASK